MVGRVGRAQRLGVHSVRAGRSRSRTQMRRTTTISVVLASPSPDGDRLRFKSPVAGTCDRSRGKCARLRGLFSPGRIVRCKRDGARSASGAYHAGPLPLARSSLPQQPVTSTLTSLEAVVVVAPPFPLHSSPSFSSSLYVASVSVISVSPPLPRHGHFRRGGHRPTNSSLPLPAMKSKEFATNRPDDGSQHRRCGGCELTMLTI